MVRRALPLGLAVGESVVDVERADGGSAWLLSLPMDTVNRVPGSLTNKASIGALKAGIGYGLGSWSGAIDKGARRGGLEFPEGRCASLVGGGVGLVAR